MLSEEWHIVGDLNINLYQNGYIKQGIQQFFSEID